MKPVGFMLVHEAEKGERFSELSFSPPREQLCERPLIKGRPLLPADGLSPPSLALHRWPHQQRPAAGPAAPSSTRYDIRQGRRPVCKLRST